MGDGSGDGSHEARAGARLTSRDRHSGHLWTPWRMRYVAGGAREDGCIFCNRLGEGDDVAALILHRGPRAFVIMNLFPYNTGHVMIVPNAHVSSPEDADPETMAEMAALRAPLLRALRRALACEGFNLGLNVGDVAGAGVADHLHEHVVPRWLGDANFMPILASTMVMPELIPVTYAKLRAELQRELGDHRPALSVVISDDAQRVLVDTGQRLPRVDPDEGEPVWRAVLRDCRARGIIDPELAGWAGEDRASSGPVALLLRTTLSPNDQASTPSTWAPVESVLSGPDGAFVAAAVQRLGVSD